MSRNSRDSSLDSRPSSSNPDAMESKLYDHSTKKGPSSNPGDYGSLDGSEEESDCGAINMERFRQYNPDMSIELVDSDNGEDWDVAWEKEPRIVSDNDYYNKLGVATITEFPNTEDDLRAAVLGTFMAKGERLDTGYNIEEFDFQLQEVTGRREDNPHNFISLQRLTYFMNLSPEEAKKCENAKINVLLHDMFQEIVDYNPATATLKMRLPDELRQLYESIRESGTINKRRKERAEQQKLDRMADPANRQKYMASNNLLVELMIRARNRICENEIPWNDIRNEYREMMTEQNSVYQNYCSALHLDKIREEFGFELNEKSTRELFGRGSISKALSDGIYRKIEMTNDPKRNLVLRFNGDFLQDPSQFTYKREDFDQNDDEIRQHREQVCEKKRESMIAAARSKSEVKKAKQARELEERRKNFQPFALGSVYVPSRDEPKAPSFNDSVSSQMHHGTEMQPEPPRPTTPSISTSTSWFTSSMPVPVVAMNEHSRNISQSSGLQRTSIFGGICSEDNTSLAVEEQESSDEEPSSRENTSVNFTDEEDGAVVCRSKPPKKPVTHTTQQKNRAAITRSVRENSPALCKWEVPSRPISPPPKERRISPKSVDLQSKQQPLPSLNTTTPSLRSSAQPVLSANSVAMKSSFIHPRLSVSSMSSISHLDRKVPIPVQISQEPCVLELGQHMDSVSDRNIFLHYIQIHVYVHRHIHGSAKRFWSQIRASFEAPFNHPQLIFGDNWEQQIEAAIPNIKITRTRNDLFLEWDEDDAHTISS